MDEFMSFQPEKLRVKLKEGINRVCKANGWKQEFVFNEIRNKMKERITTGLPALSTIQNWIRKKLTDPMDYEKLFIIVLYCLINGPKEISYKWVKETLTANGIAEKAWPLEITEAIKEKQKSNPPPLEEGILNLSSVMEDYIHNVIEWACPICLIWDESPLFGSIDQVYVHSRLDLFPIPVPEDDKLPFYGEDLLIVENMHAFIIAPPGSGKSTLFQKLAWLLAKGGIGDVLPIPLDWQRVKTASTRDLLLNAVNEFLPKLSVQHKEEFVNILEQRLTEGSAILLIDNYYDSDTSGTRFSVTLERSIADWKRVIIFGRYNPQSEYIQKFNLYSLTQLSLKEIARFVRAWSSITGYSIVPEKIVSLVLLSQWVENIAVMPLFLNIICLAVGYNQLRVQDRLWPLLDFALARITDVETGDKAEGYLLRRLLAEVAWYSWKNLCFLSPADVHELWYKKYGPTGERLFQLAYKRGLIRSAVNNQQIIFINPVIETALAAEGWLLEIQQSEKRDWATALEQAKGKARMINTIGFLAAQLGQENNLVELEKLLIHICAPSQTDIFGLNWLVAGHCLAGLDQRVQEELERKTKIAGQIRNHLIKLLENPLSMEVINSVKRMLEVIHTEPVFRHLIQYVQDKQQPEVARWFIIQILGKWSREDILEPFRRFALDTKEDINVRVRVIEALGQSRLDGAVPILVKLINDSDVREYVVKALATHNTVAATRALLQTWDLNADGSEPFLQFSNPEILPELEQSLLKDAIRDYFTLQAIAAIDNEQAVKILTRFLYYDDEDYFSHVASWHWFS